jgi:hypothetical protein
MGFLPGWSLGFRHLLTFASSAFVELYGDNF